MITDLNQQKSPAWEKVMTARSEERFNGLEIMNAIFESFFELHGDRSYGDDCAVAGGLAYLGQRPVTVILQQKGRGYSQRLSHRNGMMLPEGYRKALRLMKQAEKFNRPIVCIIDTPGAYPGVEAEQRGQAEAIARNICEMSILKVPVLSLIIGEGGSGGALALGVANRIIMLENAVFSVVSPEGCASILWKDSSRAPQAAEQLKLTSAELQQLQVIDSIVQEGENSEDMYDEIRKKITSSFDQLCNLTPTQIVEQRIQKFRRMGIPSDTKGEICYR